MKRTCLCCAALFALAACREQAGEAPRPPAPATTPPPLTRLDSDRARASYMVGLDLARELRPIRDDIDLAIVQQAMRTALAGEKPLLDPRQADAVRREFTARLRTERDAQMRALAARNRAAGAAFLAANGRRPGVVSTASGLQYQVLRPGRGPRPPRDATVSVHYRARTLDGREFANSYRVQHPETLALTRAMPGLAEGLSLMAPGSQYRLWLPARLAYGEAGKPGEVEPNATLVFEIELLEVAAGAATPPRSEARR